MKMNENLAELLETEMDRKGFLMYLGAAAVGLLGVSAVLKAITTPLAKQSSTTNNSQKNAANLGASGYGGGAYGGKAS